MHIKSRLIEPSKVICDLRLPVQYQTDSLIEQISTVEKDNKYVALESKLLYTSGLCFRETVMSTVKRVTDEFHTEGEHVRYFFFIKGHSRVQGGAGNQNYDHDIGIMHRNFLYSSGGTAEIRADNEIRHMLVIMSREYFLHLLVDQPWTKGDPFIQYVINGRAEDRPNETYPITLEMLSILQDILDSDHIEVNRKYYIELKLRELFFTIYEQQQLSHGIKGLHDESNKSLESVKAFLVMNFNNPPTIKRLAKLFLMNEKKLKQDFKAFYGITIYAFIIQLRMQKARKMLLKNYSVSEMATELGYRSVSHFIKTFKSYYGYTPKEALMSISKFGLLSFLQCVFV